MVRRRLALLAALLLAPPGAAAATADVLGYLRANPSAARFQSYGIGMMSAYGMVRPALMSGIPNVIDVPVTLSAHPRLRLGLALRDRWFGEDMLANAEPTRFTVSLEFPDGRDVLLLERVIDARSRAGDRRWFDVDLDLARFAGTQATLRLAHEVAADPRTIGKTFALWGRPLVYDAAEQQARSNLLLITIDALRADHLGCYGYARPTTPRLDRLAAEGVRFAAAFTTAPMTLPSMAQLFTSAYFPRFESPTLLSSLSAGGVPRTKAIVNNPYLHQWLTLQTRDGFDSTTGVSAWRADKITAAALKWLDRHRGERFALFLHYLDTHTPYRPPPADAAPFTDSSYRGRVGGEFGDVAGARAGQYDARDRAQIVALYDGALHCVDRELGRLLDGLGARGVLESTLVVVTADHGEEHWDHGSFFHGQSLYDELLHVPLLVRLPRAAHAGRVVAEQVRSIDIVPTIAEVLALPPQARFQGASLLPLVMGAGSAPPRPLFARAANPEVPYRFAVRTPARKLILTVAAGAEELYDLRADPRETHDLAGDPDAAETLGQLRGLMGVFRRELDGSGLHVRAAARDGAAHRVEVTLAVSPGQVIDNPDRIALAPADRLTLSADARTLTWSGTVGTRPAGIRLDAGQSGAVTPDLALDVRLRVDGADVPPAAVYLASDATHPPASPFTYKRVPPTLVGKATETPSLLASAPPELGARGEEPVSFFLWRYPDAEPAAAGAPLPDEEVRRRLRALGYTQ